MGNRNFSASARMVSEPTSLFEYLTEPYVLSTYPGKKHLTNVEIVACSSGIYPNYQFSRYSQSSGIT